MEASQQTVERIRECMTRALELDQAEARTVDRYSTAADLAKWDSLGHLKLILELEWSFGMTFDDEQIVELASVERIMKIVGTNGR